MSRPPAPAGHLGDLLSQSQPAAGHHSMRPSASQSSLNGARQSSSWPSAARKTATSRMDDDSSSSDDSSDDDDDGLLDKAMSKATDLKKRLDDQILSLNNTQESLSGMKPEMMDIDEAPPSRQPDSKTSKDSGSRAADRVNGSKTPVKTVTFSSDNDHDMHDASSDESDSDIPAREAKSTPSASQSSNGPKFNIKNSPSKVASQADGIVKAARESPAEPSDSSDESSVVSSDSSESDSESESAVKKGSAVSKVAAKKTGGVAASVPATPTNTTTTARADSSSSSSVSTSSDSGSDSDSAPEVKVPAKLASVTVPTPTLKTASRTKPESSVKATTKLDSQPASKSKLDKEAKSKAKTTPAPNSKTAAKDPDSSMNGFKSAEFVQDDSSEDEGSESADEGSNNNQKAIVAAPATQTVAKSSSKAKRGDLPSFVAPGFELHKIDPSSDANEMAEMFSSANLKGKQIWYLTAPVGVPISVVQDLLIPTQSLRNGLPMIQKNGQEYAMSFDDPATTSSFQLLIPQKQGDGYQVSKRAITHAVHVTRTETFAPDLMSGQEAAKKLAAIKPPPRPQPAGLKPRSTPIGVPHPNPTPILPPKPLQSKASRAAAAAAAESAAAQKSSQKRKLAEESESAAAPVSSVQTPKSIMKKRKTDLGAVPATETPVPASTKAASVVKPQTPILPPAPLRRSTSTDSGRTGQVAPASNGVVSAKKSKVSKEPPRPTSSSSNDSTKSLSIPPSYTAPASVHKTPVPLPPRVGSHLNGTMTNGTPTPSATSTPGPKTDKETAKAEKKAAKEAAKEAAKVEKKAAKEAEKREKKQRKEFAVTQVQDAEREIPESPNPKVLKEKKEKKKEKSSGRQSSVPLPSYYMSGKQ